MDNINLQSRSDNILRVELRDNEQDLPLAGLDVTYALVSIDGVFEGAFVEDEPGVYKTTIPFNEIDEGSYYSLEITTRDGTAQRFERYAVTVD